MHTMINIDDGSMCRGGSITSLVCNMEISKNGIWNNIHMIYIYIYIYIYICIPPVTLSDAIAEGIV